jgi:putative phosphoesterase
MRLLICSDIHGDIDGARAAVENYEKYGADALIILGDILYHGPRNNLPNGYMPKAVIELLNKYSDKIIAVRGNCDAEVDAMVLNFPITEDIRTLSDGKITLYLTHGHRYSPENPPKMARGDVLIAGHTHIPARIKFGDNNLYLNPGSTSIPKGGFDRSFMLYDDGEFKILDFSGNEII